MNEMPVPTAAKPPKKVAVINAGWLCFVIGVVLLFAHVGTMLLSIPFFVASLVLSIIGLTQGRIASGVILLCLSVMAPLILVPGMMCARVGESMAKQKIETTSALRHVSFEDVKGYLDGDYFYVKGRVRNNGSSSVTYVKVQVELLDKSGTVMNTDWTYAVAGEELAPGAAKTFETMTEGDSRIKSYRYKILVE
jgi:hypothetical protein